MKKKYLVISNIVLSRLFCWVSSFEVIILASALFRKYECWSAIKTIFSKPVWPVAECSELVQSQARSRQGVTSKIVPMHLFIAFALEAHILGNW